MSDNNDDNEMKKKKIMVVSNSQNRKKAERLKFELEQRKDLRDKIAIVQVVLYLYDFSSTINNLGFFKIIILCCEI
jgi:hypothetical protein